MKTIIVTGPIGAGKSSVSGVLKEYGIPVYDCDSAVKELYKTHNELAVMVTDDLFDNHRQLSKLEDALFPVLMDSIQKWMSSQKTGMVAVESATMLDKSYFDSFGDYVLLVDAPQELRVRRVLSRGGISEASLYSRMALQQDQRSNPRVSCIIDNSGSPENLKIQIDKFLKSINHGNTKN